MSAPQSDDEIRPIERALQQMDALLSIRWNPTALCIQPPHFDANGKPYAARYEGRWEVVRERERGQPAGIVYTVRFDGEGRDAYRPVGWWLVEYMQRWDAAQRHYLDERDRAWREHETAEARGIQMDDNANQDFLDEQFHKVGGRHWIGRGFGAGARRSLFIH